MRNRQREQGNRRSRSSPYFRRTSPTPPEPSPNEEAWASSVVLTPITPILINDSLIAEMAPGVGSVVDLVSWSFAGLPTTPKASGATNGAATPLGR